MGRRCKFRCILNACFIGILPTSTIAHSEWIYSATVNAPMVSIFIGDDANISVGIQKVSVPYNFGHHKNLLKQEITEISHMIEEIIELEEGFRPKPYLCSEGYITIGYGTKLHKEKGLSPSDFTIAVTKESAFSLLEDELARLRSAIAVSSKESVYNSLNKERKAIILSMGYQLGINGLFRFKKMWAAIEEGDFTKAHAEMLDSRWAIQTKGRAERHAYVMYFGSLDPYLEK